MNKVKKKYKRIVAIIPARGGSKGIPGKNIMDFCGKPLLAWSILQAKQAKTIDEVYVTSDDEAILKVAEDYGAIPISRPAKFSTDTATSESALLHALDHIEKEGAMNVDLVVFLQATSPLREPEDIDGAVHKLINEKADSLLSTGRLEIFFIWGETDKGFTSLNYDYRRRQRRQDLKSQYVESGSIYIFEPDILRKTNNRLGGEIANYEMDFWKTCEIDSLDEKSLCEWYFMNRLMKKFTNLKSTDIELLVYDFDGVMTDNRVLTLQDGTEAVFATRADGLAVSMIKEMGFAQIILSTEENPVVEARARKIGIPSIHGVGDKLKVLEAYCAEQKISLKKVLFVGNDINDLQAMISVGISVATSDAHPTVKKIAKFVLKTPGGAGAIRELADYLIDKNLKKR
jgi:YrbI family 3-deoxy-D-manno-octulosonate 8-phosphate phosphatase